MWTEPRCHFRVAHLNAHALNIIQRIDQALKITTMPKLCAPYILLEKSAIGVIVGRITVHPLIQHHGIKREPPVVRRGMICVTITFTRIVQGTDCFLVGVQVVLSIGWIIAKSLGYRGRKHEV